jgi:prefoldin subunit 5
MGLHEAINDLHEAIDGIRKAINSLHEAIDGIREAINSLHEAMNGTSRGDEWTPTAGFSPLSAGVREASRPR